MRIAIDGSVFQHNPTGIAKATYYLYEAVKRIDADIDLVVVHRKKLLMPVEQFCRTYRVSDNGNYQCLEKSDIREIIRKLKPDAIHFPWNGKLPLLPGRDIKTITTLHDVLPLQIKGYFGRNFFLRLRYWINTQKEIFSSDILLTDSFFSRKSILHFFHSRSDIEVIHLASTIDRVSDAEITPEIDSDYFLYFGGYDKRKGIDIMLKAFIKLKQDGNLSSRLIITGEKRFLSHETDVIIENAKQLNIVQELGYVDDQRLRKLIIGAKGMIYPSVYEGFGLPVIEALSLGCPVITTACTSLLEICEDAVLYFDHTDVNSLASAIIKMETDNEFRISLRRKGIEHSKKFSWDFSAKRFLSILKRKIP